LSKPTVQIGGSYVSEIGSTVEVSEELQPFRANSKAKEAIDPSRCMAASVAQKAIDKHVRCPPIADFKVCERTAVATKLREG